MKPKNTTIGWLVCYGLFFGLLLALWVFLNQRTPVISARQGVAVAPVPDDRTVYMVTGEWRRYEGLYAYDNLPETGGEFVTDIRNNRRMSGYTYAFTLQVAEGSRYYFLLPRPHNSRLWVNGIPVLGEEGGGIRSDDLFKLGDYGAGSYSFVLQVSGASAYNGYQGVLLGRYTAITRTQNRWLMLDLVAVGLSLMLVLQCTALFLFKRGEIYLPLLAVAALMELGHFMLIPRHPMLGFFSLGSLAFYAQFSFLQYFMCKQFVPRTAPKWMDRLVLCAAGLAAVCVLVLPGQALRVVHLAGYLYAALCLWLLGKGMGEGVAETRIILPGILCQLSCEVFYLLLNAGLVPQGTVDVIIMPAQYLRFAALLAFAFAAFMRFAGKYREADILSAELEQRVKAQTAEIVESAQRLAQTQKRNRQTITGIVHNLRNPLFALGGYVDMLRDDEAGMPDSQQHLLEAADRKLVEINTMVDDMLLLSRLEEGNIEFHFTSFDACEMLRQATEDMRLKAGRLGMEIELDCTEGFAMTGDSYRLRQVVDILLDNALRHSGAKTPVCLGARRLEGWVELYVRDEGVGMDEDQAAIIFERYTTGRTTGSVGLGLSIARQVAGRHKGEILLETAPGQGACFRVRLPDNL